MFKEQLRSSQEWRICYPYSKKVGRGVSQRAWVMLGVVDSESYGDLSLPYGILYNPVE